MNRLLQRLHKLPNDCVGHLLSFYSLSLSDRISFMRNKELRKEWQEDIDFSSEYFVRTPTKERLQQRREQLQKRYE